MELPEFNPEDKPSQGEEALRALAPELFNERPEQINGIRWAEATAGKYAVVRAMMEPSMEGMTSAYTNAFDVLANGADPVAKTNMLRFIDSYGRYNREEVLSTLAEATFIEDETPQQRADVMLGNVDTMEFKPLTAEEILMDDGLDTSSVKDPGSPVPSTGSISDKQRSNIDIRENARVLDQIKIGAQARLDSGAFALIADAIKSIVLPWSTNTTLQEWVEVVTGEDPGINWTSEHARALKKALAEMPQDELWRRAPELMQKLSETDNIWGLGIDFEKAMLLESLLSEADYTKTDALIDNMVDALDTSFVGIGIGKSVKALASFLKGTKHASNMTSTYANQGAVLGYPHATSAVGLQNASGQPYNALQVAAVAALSDAPRLERSLAGTRFSQWLYGFQPRGSTSTVLVGPDPELIRALEDTIAPKLTVSERQTRISKEMRKLSGLKGVKLFKPLSSTVSRDADGVFGIRATYTDKDGNPFETIREMEFAIQNAGLDPNDGMHIFKKNPSTGHYEYVDDPSSLSPTTKGKYLFAQDNFYAYNSRDAQAFEDATDNWATRLFGDKARYFETVNEMFTANLSRALSSITDKVDAINATAFAKIKEDYLSLGRSSQKKVNAIVEEGSQLEKTFDDAELIARGLTEEERKGYFAVRRLWDTHYALENVDQIRNMNSQGLQLYRQPDTFLAKDMELAYVKPHRKVPVGVKFSEAKYLDPENDTVLTMGTKKDLETNVYDNGDYLVKLGQPVERNGEQIEWMLVKNGIVEQRKLRLSDTVINYTEGYVRRLYDNRFYLVVERGGKKEVIAATDSQERVLKAKAILEANASPGEIYHVRRDRAEDLEDLAPLDLINSNGPRIRLPQRRRGQGVLAIEKDGTIGTDLATTVDPNQALIEATQQMGQLAAKHGTLDEMMTRWMKTYGNLLPPDKRGAWPELREVIKEVNLDKATRNEALALWEHIQHLRGRSPTPILDKYWTATFHGIADFVDKNGGIAADVLRGGANKIANLSPSNTLRTIPFVAYLVANPARQLIVQSSQLIQMGALDIRNAYRLPLHTGMMAFTRGAEKLMNGAKGTPKYAKARQHYRSMVAASAKMHGISTEEYLRLYNHYWKRSGISDAIDHHALVNGFTSHHAINVNANPLWDATKEVGRKGVQALRTVGFDAGEHVNLMGTYIAAYKRWKANNPGKALSNVDLEEISADARGLSLGMNQSGKFKYNDGAMGVITQFMAVPHKMALAMFGQNKVFTKQEVMKLWALNLTAFGTASWGLSDLLEQARMDGEFFTSLDQDTFDLVKDGVLDTALNYTYRNLTELAGLGTPTSDVNFTESLAAAGGVSLLKDRYDAFLEGEYSTVLGPGVHFLFAERGKFQTAIQEIMAITKDSTLDENSIGYALKALARMPSGTNNFLKAYGVLEYQRLEGKQGLTDEVRSAADSIAYALGFNLEADSDKWNDIISKRATRQEVEDHAKDWVARWGSFKKRLMADASFVDQQEEFLKQLIAEKALYSGKPDEAKIFWRAVQTEVRKLEFYDSPVANTIRFALEGANSPTEKLITSLETNDMIPKKDKELILNMLRDINNINEDDYGRITD